VPEVVGRSHRQFLGGVRSDVEYPRQLRLAHPADRAQHQHFALVWSQLAEGALDEGGRRVDQRIDHGGRVDDVPPVDLAAGERVESGARRLGGGGNAGDAGEQGHQYVGRGA
jgi:hypothetical protein